MLEMSPTQGKKGEELLSELASAASRATTQHGMKGAFIDVELDLWHALQAKLRANRFTRAVENPTQKP